MAIGIVAPDDRADLQVPGAAAGCRIERPASRSGARRKAGRRAGSDEADIPNRTGPAADFRTIPEEHCHRRLLPAPWADEPANAGRTSSVRSSTASREPNAW